MKEERPFNKLSLRLNTHSYNHVNRSSQISPFSGVVEPYSKFQRKYNWRLYDELYAKTLCSWIRSKEALKLICSDNGDALTPEILNSWIQQSLICIVVTETKKNTPIGFFTLSVQEAKNLPINAVEICHLMVKTQKNYFSIGEFICDLAKTISRWHGFSLLIGRVVPINMFGLTLAKSAGFNNVHTREKWAKTEFSWFVFRLRQHQFFYKGAMYGIKRIKGTIKNY